MNEAQVRALVAQMDTADSAQSEQAWSKLRSLGQDAVPFLLEAFPRFRKWQGRRDLVFHAIRYARTSEPAFQLGLAALKDRSTIVRYRACGLLAYALRPDAVPALEPLASHPDPKTAEDARAALDAIKHRNHHYFVDRSHTGRSFWEVNEGDAGRP
ncbi:MAG: HEAT repeat domain-containing protein [Planctomycetes bacterium]|nr:HEAT repeat domain-containing protein [Planctomycetota bacterium]